MASLDDTLVVLWNDESPASLNLARSLRDKGYFVKNVYSGASKPVAQHGSNFFSGYAEIYSYL